MGAWSLVEGLKLDLSGMSETDIAMVISSLESGDVEAIISDLAKERKEMQNMSRAVDLAFQIAGIVLSKGISLV